MYRPCLIAMAALAIAFPALGQVSKPALNRNYIQLSPPQLTETGEKIEVVEFFWYRCPHCYALEPLLAGWIKKLPQDAQFRRIPAVFNDEWALDARIFYALESLGQLERVHRPLFDAIHKQGGANLKGQTYMKWATDWLATQGVDPDKFESALRSFTVDSQVKRAFQTAQAFKLDGVPTLAVNGRYVISASMVSDRREMLDVSSQLVAASRKGSVAKGESGKGGAAKTAKK
jgi:thiol:disulfide interchange protein DsbA